VKQFPTPALVTDRDPARRAVRVRAHVAARWCGLVAMWCTCVVAALPGTTELLEPERAFALSARAIDPSTVEVSYAIAPGYYLYRDKLKFAVDPGGVPGAPTLPPGQMKEDSFFGRSETYRGAVVVRLPLAAVSAGREVTLTADSQGCADAGVCYPAQRQQLKLSVPRAGAGAGPVVYAVPPKRGWFK
jgi:thiol:disulfide interchange protein DsbD